MFTPQLMGHLAYNDIIENSKIGNVLYPVRCSLLLSVLS